MPDSADTPLARIHALAARALDAEALPGALKPLLEEIAALSDPKHGDTPEASDTPMTDGQSL